MFIYIYTQCHTCVYKQYISTAFTYSDVILEAHSFYTEITCKLCPFGNQYYIDHYTKKSNQCIVNTCITEGQDFLKITMK